MTAVVPLLPAVPLTHSLLVTLPDSEGIPESRTDERLAGLRDDPALVERGLVVEDVLGTGGHSTVYRARDERHARDVAIKVLRPEARLENAAERFAQEVRVVAGLRHPHILPLYDSGALRDGRPFSVMPVAHGRSLRAKIDGGPLALHDAVHLAREIAEALAYLHALGWVHRDVKPENVLVESGHAVLTDFGIAAPTDTVTRHSAPQHVTHLWSGQRFTSIGSVVGTLPYVSPENLLGEASADPRGDVYALGIVLFEMLAGHLPFHTDPAALVSDRLRHPLPALAGARADVPADIDTVIARATHPDPAQRFASITEFVAALDAVPAVSRSGARGTRRREIIALSVILAVAVLGVWRAFTPVALDPRRIIVADLSNDTGDPALARIGSLAGDLITASLSHERGLTVINADMSLGSRQRPRLPAADSSLRRETLALVARARAGLAVTGAYYREGRDLALLAELIDTRAGEVIGAVGPIRAPADVPERGLRVLADSVAAVVKRRGNGAAPPLAASS